MKAKSKTKGEFAAGKIVVENVNVPGYTQTVDATMYGEMRRALMAILPSKPPGLTQTEIRQTVVGRLSKALYPGGAKAEWWSKLVQLDLEAKQIIRREDTKPLRWHAVKK
jgi:hypothetical protein